jgi:hypothetical protein
MTWKPNATPLSEVVTRDEKPRPEPRRRQGSAAIIKLTSNTGDLTINFAAYCIRLF